MRVLVMGGTRFNGLSLVRDLVQHGHEVTTFNRGVSEAVLPKGVRRLYGDRTNYEQLLETMRREDFDCVQDISGYTLNDVKPLFEAFKGRIGHYIFAGSTVVYADTNVLPIRETHAVDEGPKQGDYGKNKLIVERFLFNQQHDIGFNSTVMSFSMVFGPNNNSAEREQRVFMRLLGGRPVLIPGDGTTMGQIGHVDDEAKALRMAMLNPNTFGKRYNVTGKDFYTDEGYIDTFAEVVGVDPEKVFIPASLMDDIWTDRVSLDGSTVQLRAPRTYATGLPTESSNMRFAQSLIQRLNPQLHHWNHNTIFSIDALREDTGWEPDYGFKSAVEHTFEWFMREGLDKVREYDWSWEDQLLDMVRRA
ncbi:MAG: NAD-dependent epimerase/dehydratase family protein [Chloroflexota bacterium]